MKKIKIILVLSVVLTWVLVISCDTTTIQEIQPVVTNPTYNTNIAPLMNAKCVSCHSTNGQYPALTNYDEVKEATENGDLQCRIANSCGSIMPPSGKLPQVFIDMVNNWKLQGYAQQ
ncbi:MAG TPA: hypothetical protein PKN96_04480 [Flavobacterium sp.]|uniref:hypothetical protein n=1 Tax=Flavobacterium sp. TaxID=239 RepID=UPI002C2A7CD6|nr:hypothetical protein [Flavobacterium sp.]HNP32524.1 hypothetical protein [Flavobacterium sp.]